LAYEIHTTAGVSGITVCLNAAALPEAEFNTAVILHGVNGAWQPEPTTRDASARTLCATVASLSPFAVGIPVDAAPPSIQCAAPPAGWSAGNVTLACTAVDAGAGLDNSADASFVLTTNVAPGAETANAATGSRQVCDQAGNCATAGPIAGIRIDRKAPVVQIAMPVNRTFIVNEAAAAAYTCADGGTIVACQGTVAHGGPIDTASAGAKTFTVTATDGAGRTTTANVSYTVGYNVRQLGPTLSIKRNKTLPVAIQLVSAAGANVSLPSIVVTMTGLRAVSSGASLPLQDSPQLNPDHTFRYVLGAYGYALGTKGLAVGTYELQFTAANDPVVHTLRFRIVK
jgi:hypothetical protein